MDNETIRTIFTCCATLGAVVITQLFTYLNSKSNKNDSIYKQQYDEIFAPIHRTLFFTPSQNVTDDLEIISNIIYKNYSLASDALIEEFGKCFDNNEITFEFETIIRSGYILLRNKLGYTKLKMNKNERKKSAQTIITNKSKIRILRTITRTIIYIAICIWVVIASVIAIYFKL
ncbi:MAG: hypothetical protein NC397_02005 [Clostridium sp.]|nr:hypothetical protein [Clostridium sp.]